MADDVEDDVQDDAEDTGGGQSPDLVTPQEDQGNAVEQVPESMVKQDQPSGEEVEQDERPVEPSSPPPPARSEVQPEQE